MEMMKEMALKIRKYAYFFLPIFLAISSFAYGQENSYTPIIQKIMQTAAPYNNLFEISAKMPPHFLDPIDPNEIVEWIEEEFKKNPPGDHPRRDLLFIGMDAAALAGEKEKYASLYRYNDLCSRSVCDALEKAVPTDDLLMYKLYNEGTILCTSNVSIGFDIILDSQDNDLAVRFAKRLDGLFISHRDGDHYDYKSSLLGEMKKAGKPIIIVDDQPAAAIGEKLSSGRIKDLEWIAFKGGHINLNYSSFFLLTIGKKWKVIHSGDNTRWMDFAESEYAKGIDLFLLKPESMFGESVKHVGIQEAMTETLRKIHPRFAVPHHLLELGHGVNAYGHDMGLRLDKQAPPGVKIVRLQWGESYTFTK